MEQKQYYTKITVEVCGPGDLDQTVSIKDNRWDLSLMDIMEVWNQVLSGMGFSDKTIEDYWKE